jgi:superfamily II DNA or RNA helicase
MLKDLSFPAQMSKGIDDIATGFYLPCMRTAIDYARVTGYFTSGAYLLAWPALRGFVERQGHIRIICSPVLSARDIDALYAGYRARDDDDLAQQLAAELRSLLANDQLRRPAQVLAGLISDGTVDVRLAFLDDSAPAATKRIFHDKVGIFTDSSGDSVGFRGTMNETYLGLSSDGNLESIDIFPSWIGGRDEERLRDAATRFELLWNGELSGVSIRAIPDQTADELRRIASERGWREIAEELEAELNAERAIDEGKESTLPARRELRSHQIAALAAWDANGRRGILEHATGSGKTATALDAMRRRLADGEPSVVVVPSKVLLRQWEDEIASELADRQPKILTCGGGNRDWAGGLLRTWIHRPATEARIVVAVLNTAAKDEFREQLRGTPFLLVVDEVHRAGSPEYRGLLALEATSRLGLSATPRRYGDPIGTDAILGYFEGIVHTYTLRQAIDDGFLTPYTYDPHVVRLTDGEQRRWDAATARIGARLARARPEGDSGGPLDDRQLSLMLIQRARIAKAATGKTDLAASILREEFKPGDRWLVYCDDRAQLDRARAALTAVGFTSLAYFDAMTGDQALTIRDFELNGGILVAIKCLDEGVDIPGATHALILASSKNPREFVQRRGRILRPAAGKTISHLHDTIVIPAETNSEPTFRSMLWSELARGVEFGNGAINPQAQTKLEQVASDLGLDVRELADLGLEDDNDEEGANE